MYRRFSIGLIVGWSSQFQGTCLEPIIVGDSVLAFGSYHCLQRKVAPDLHCLSDNLVLDPSYRRRPKLKLGLWQNIFCGNQKVIFWLQLREVGDLERGMILGETNPLERLLILFYLCVFNCLSCQGILTATFRQFQHYYLDEF